eukprot:Gb_15875 [translate_table: standard]
MADGIATGAAANILSTLFVPRRPPIREQDCPSVSGGLAGKGAEYCNDVLRDLAVYTGQKEENCLFRAGQGLKKFPSEEEKTRACKRIFLLSNDIESLPKSFKCPDLVTLVLAENRYLREISDSFLLNLTSLKVLDLSGMNIKSLPTSCGQLQLLKILRLRDMLIEELPERELQCLKRLSLEECSKLAVIPRGISELTSLESLLFRVDTMNNWMEMRTLYMIWTTDGQGDLPEDAQRMNKLRDLALENCSVEILPNWICEFRNLRDLLLSNCELKELPALESLPKLKRLEIRGCKQLKMLGERFGTAGGFPMLEVSNLHNLPILESLVGSTSTEGVMEAGAMARLENLRITACWNLKRLPLGIESLKSIKRLVVDRKWWDEIIVWVDDNMRSHFSTQVEITFRDYRVFIGEQASSRKERKRLLSTLFQAALI